MGWQTGVRRIGAEALSTRCRDVLRATRCPYRRCRAAHEGRYQLSARPAGMGTWIELSCQCELMRILVGGLEGKACACSTSTVR
jgi:hypothetical protein